MRDDTAMPLPAKSDFRQALRIYVAGRNRFWTADEKRVAAGGPGTSTKPDVGGMTEAEPRAGVAVPVPETLQFHRAAGTWRDEVPGGRGYRARPRND
jgi:hypothetical protein